MSSTTARRITDLPEQGKKLLEKDDRLEVVTWTEDKVGGHR